MLSVACPCLGERSLVCLMVVPSQVQPRCPVQSPWSQSHSLWHAKPHRGSLYELFSVTGTPLPPCHFHRAPSLGLPVLLPSPSGPGGLAHAVGTLAQKEACLAQCCPLQAGHPVAMAQSLLSSQRSSRLEVLEDGDQALSVSECHVLCRLSITPRGLRNQKVWV